jgi:hypothetical protein
VQGDFIGTDVSGTTIVGGGTNTVGIGFYAPGGLVGGTSPDARNIIGGFGTGITDIEVLFAGPGHLVEGNFFGTDASGTHGLGNEVGVSANYFGATITGNLISDNHQAGINLGNGFQIQGNLIGTDVTGKIGLGNGWGINGGGNGSIIGGPTAAARNIISGNFLGIIDYGGALIEGNYIGTDITGTMALPTGNSYPEGNNDGIWVHDGVTIGGTAPGAGNVISGNSGIGIRIFGSNIRIEGNYIGTDTTGTIHLGNGSYGVLGQDGGTNNVVGGLAPGAGNIIAFNPDGVQPANGTVIAQLSNSTYGNRAFYINPSTFFQTVLSTPAGLTVSGTAPSAVVQVFANPTAGDAEGRTLLASFTTDSSGHFAGAIPAANLPANLSYVSASVTGVNSDATFGGTGFYQNVAIPTVSAITAPLAPVAVNTAVNVSASFTDPIPSSTHAAVWSWGDSTTTAGTVTETNGAGTVTGSHSYTVDGVYTVTLTVTNNGGGSAQSVFQYMVVYDPSAGFVTGAGWFTALAGAYNANPALTGQANFGFDVKYPKGSTAPTGSFQLDFPAANLSFQSTSYEWLVINGSVAQFRGSGTINGAGNYGFLVTVYDGGQGQSKIRIKIWDKNNGNAVIFDTQLGAVDTDLPTTLLGGGNIRVHSH